MCRLYGLRATHPTRVSCELVEAQNSLIRQSEEDARGLSNPHGWGIGYVQDGTMYCEREVEPASSDEEFRHDAARVDATTVVAHVRRATVGKPRLVNTHPFRHDNAMLAHNGHIPAFDEVRPRLVEAMLPAHREAVHGDTDSEHFFQLLLSNRARHPGWSMTRLLRHTASSVIDWASEVVPEAEIALNFLWAIDDELVGMRLGRTLWYLQLRQVHECSVCGQEHAHPDDGRPYRSVEFASERITGEQWRAVPEGTIFHLDRDMCVEFDDFANESG